MTSVVSSTPLLHLKLPSVTSSELYYICSYPHLPNCPNCPNCRCVLSSVARLSLRTSQSSISAVIPSDEEVSKNIEKIVSAGEIERSSMVLVSIGSEEFVDMLFASSPCQQLLVVHDSLLTLACIKEKYDKVNCWQGELIYLPKKWASFDVMFLDFLPSLPFDLDQVFGALVGRCLPGTRLVISHPEGREVLDQQRQQYPDVIVSNLPDKLTLENAAVGYSFEVVEFVDEPGFYLSHFKIQRKMLKKPGFYGSEIKDIR